MYPPVFTRKLVWDKEQNQFALQFGVEIPSYITYEFRGFRQNNDSTEIHKYEVVLENEGGVKRIYDVYVIIFLSKDGKVYEKVELFILKKVVNNSDEVVYSQSTN